jgi:hypothetical protein
MRARILVALFAAAACGGAAQKPVATPQPHTADAAAIIADGKAMLDETKGFPHPAEVAVRWEKACDEGLVDVCVALAQAWQAGDLYFAQCPDSYGGLGIDTANPERARVFYGKACKGGHRDACAQLDSLGRGEPSCI